MAGWLVGFYGISTFVGHLTPNQFYFKQFRLAWVHSLIVKIFLIQVIQLSISIDFIYTQLNFKKSSTLNNSVSCKYSFNV